MTSTANPLRRRRGHWQRFWTAQATPLHTDESETGYRTLAAELRLLFADRTPERVLDVGCGNGAMFRHLGFHEARRYLGLGFSPTMIVEFGDRFPGVELRRRDAATFRAAETFGLIFSSHVVQYWDRRQLAEHLANARSMIADDGLVVVGGFPWARMRLAHARGEVNGGVENGANRRHLPAAAFDYAHELIAPRIGHWYDFPEIKKIAAASDFHVAFRGSGYYPYRFHAMLTPTQGEHVVARGRG
jgi:SAM-dependent methyltransferase